MVVGLCKTSHVYCGRLGCDVREFKCSEKSRPFTGINAVVDVVVDAIVEVGVWIRLEWVKKPYEGMPNFNRKKNVVKAL